MYVQLEHMEIKQEIDYVSQRAPTLISPKMMTWEDVLLSVTHRALAGTIFVKRILMTAQTTIMEMNQLNFALAVIFYVNLVCPAT